MVFLFCNVQYSAQYIQTTFYSGGASALGEVLEHHKGIYLFESYILLTLQTSIKVEFAEGR